MGSQSDISEQLSTHVLYSWEIHSIFCNEKNTKKNVCIYICITESLYCTAEINTRL